MQFSLAETGVSNLNMPDSSLSLSKRWQEKKLQFRFFLEIASPKNERMKDWRHLALVQTMKPATTNQQLGTSSLARASQCSGNYKSPGAERNEDHTQMRRSWLRLPFTHSQHQPAQSSPASPASLNKNQSCLLCMYRVIWLSLHGVTFANAISWLNLVDKIRLDSGLDLFPSSNTHTHTPTWWLRRRPQLMWRY